ncbi:MAG: hypothetical protein JWQ02_758, partial [Capsulimonas sp.]|nr:hypothetical protein [Capsulimonas sp.]
MLNWKDSRSGHDQDVRVQINPGTFRAVDDDLITEQLFASA